MRLFCQCFRDFIKQQQDMIKSESGGDEMDDKPEQ